VLLVGRSSPGLWARPCGLAASRGPTSISSSQASFLSP
jgi:hypothetical protein